MAKFNFPEHIKGDTFDGYTFTLSLNDLPIDLTGASIIMELKKFKEQTTADLTLSTNNSKISILSPSTDGKFQIIPQIIDISAFNYFYDIQITFSSGVVKTYIEGRWRIKQDISSS